LKARNIAYWITTIDQIRKAGVYDKIWQAFAVLLPVKTVRRDGRRADV